ncbi:MAG: hypothetical protein ACTSQ6_11550 [Candidatus Heimdallarchaeaceae archaeon]
MGLKPTEMQLKRIREEVSRKIKSQDYISEQEFEEIAKKICS